VIYLDSSVALAHLLAERTRPSKRLWETPVVSSRLLEYEIWNRLHARGLGRSLVGAADRLLGGFEFVELTPAVLRRALDPFPVPVRALDGLHLATIEFLRAEGGTVALASYDARLKAGALALGIPLHEL
jgi:predicted nucleic acid-binding protein